MLLKTTPQKKTVFDIKVTEKDGTNEGTGYVKVSSLFRVRVFRQIKPFNLSKLTFKKFPVGATAALKNINVNNRNKSNPKPQKGLELDTRPEKAKFCKFSQTLRPPFSLPYSLPFLFSALFSASSLYRLSFFRPCDPPSHQLCSLRNPKKLTRTSLTLSGNYGILHGISTLTRITLTSNKLKLVFLNKLRTIFEPNSTNLETNIATNHHQWWFEPNLNVYQTFSCGRHCHAVHRMKILRSQDVESNPGPGPAGQHRSNTNGSVEVTSMNVRGLNDPTKLRHLISNCYSKGVTKNKDSIFCFQETFIETPGLIPFLWRGNFFLTPGRGNSSGCLTLLSHHLNVIQGRSIDERAHVLACQKTDEQSVSLIIANVYAPNANNNEKIDFYNELFDLVSEFETNFNCNNTLVMGDFNLIFDSSEAKNRTFSAQERNVARAVQNMITELQLSDASNTLKEFTWRRPNSDIFSSIDRLLFSGRTLTLKNIKTNWALSLSDHAAIEASLQPNEANYQPRSKLSGLDPSLLDDPAIKEQVEQELRTMLSEIPGHWNPHQKLEFLKVCLRTLLEKAQADRKKKEVSEEHYLNLELDLAIKALANDELGVRDRAELIDHVEDLRVRKEILVENKGKRLADKLGTKWYNEGEKSTRYFLRLINRAVPDNFKELEDERGNICSTESEIEEEICTFYKNLYENYDRTIVDPDVDANFFNELHEISAEDQDSIVAPIEMEELTNILRTCKESTPGPDGISYSILKKLWTIIGPIMVESWRYTILTKTLPPSHRTSLLKLIPKAGKDLKKLTNWRPITLSNCDHKLFTKVYSTRICQKIAVSIGENQTAYLKGRLINENIRALLSTIKTANIEDNIDALIISLDAKKAFDSVEHTYIEKCLEHFGISNFIPIFRTLYSELRTDILINGKIKSGFNIKRGVKQGDALSCVLFIMCIEPLLRNIEKNNSIESVRSAKLRSNLPKSYAYADDVNCVVRNTPRCIQEVFNEYQRLTALSGLQLNAEKTELLLLRSRNLPKINPLFRISYNGHRHALAPREEVKINGVYLRQNEDRMRERNVEAVYNKIDARLKSWSGRSLSVLGKILIVKTFGIAQIIFLIQCVNIKEPDYKKLNSLLYKFIWNRHYLAAKAPERVKREIVNKNLKLGGFGMLDIVALDEGLKLKTLGRLERSEHPMSILLRNNLELEDFFFPKDNVKLSDVVTKGVDLLALDRRKGWKIPSLRSNRIFVQKTKAAKLQQALSPNGRTSIAFLNLRTQGKLTIGQLNRAELETLRRFLPRELIDFAIGTLNIPVEPLRSSQWLYLSRNALVNLNSLSSKTIRISREDPEPICIYKIGPIMSPIEAINWSNNLSKLTNTRHKDALLRLMHGELYSKERLHRYGLVQTPSCQRCNQIETLKHKYFECPYVKEIWKRTFELTDRLRSSPNSEPLTERVMACPEPSRTILTVHAEIILEIRRLKEDATFFTLPKIIIRKALERLSRRELESQVKVELNDLLEHCFT